MYIPWNNAVNVFVISMITIVLGTIIATYAQYLSGAYPDKEIAYQKGITKVLPIMAIFVLCFLSFGYCWMFVFGVAK